VLKARLDGAQLAAKLHAQRFREEREARAAAGDHARQREVQLLAEMEFLRQQLQQRTDAEPELRLLLAQTNQALQLVAERPALPPRSEVAESVPENPPRRVQWRHLWRRG
jgi:hypothetical protein